MKAEDVENNFKELCLLQDNFALNIILIIYSKDIKMLINKDILMNIKSIYIFFANNINEIKNYIISQEYCYCGRDFMNFISKRISSLQNYEQFKIFFPKNTIKENQIFDKLNIEDGWEVIESIPKELFNIRGISQFDFDSIKFNLFQLYNENKIKSLFFEQYCSYFGFSILPDITMTKIINTIIKQICYAYSLSEGDKGENSFYYLMNKDLRSGDPLKIRKYFPLISAFNLALENKIIKSYEGEVFRATHLEKDYIENHIIEGKVISNLCFISTSKLREKAKSFLEEYKRNVLFLIKIKHKNIDIDREYIYFNDEKEVLFLPYSKFKIESKEKKIYKNKEIYEVKLEALDDIHERENIKSIKIESEDNYLLMSLK